jgi:regulator of protease activity HflC (stomatin/prohibitin superfamily)
MPDFKKMFVCYGKMLLAAVVFLDLLFILGIPAELYKERISLTDLPHLFAVPGIYLRLARDMLPGIFAASAALFLASNFVASLYKLSNWREGTRHILRCTFGQPSFPPFAVVSGGEVKTSEEHVTMRVGGPGSIVTHLDSAAVLEKGGRLTRVVGPGKIGTGLLGPFERIYDAIDVRPMRWEYEVDALSKEGILVTLSADVNLQVDAGAHEPTEEMPYPVLDEAVFRASTHRWIRHPENSEEDQYFDWARRVIIGETEGILRGIIARYPLNELIGLEEVSKPGTGSPRKVIQKELEEALESRAADLGVRINSVRLGAVKMGDEVAEQWLDAWRNQWRDWAMVEEKAGEATREKLREAAKALAQVDMITAMTRSFQHSISKDDSIPRQLLIMRLIEVFDRFALEPYTRVYLPAQAIETLDRLRKLVG